jgi:hypothetical protein
VKKLKVEIGIHFRSDCILIATVKSFSIYFKVSIKGKRRVEFQQILVHITFWLELFTFAI